MKVFGLIALGLFIAGCVQADDGQRFTSVKVANPNYNAYRFIDTELNTACYVTVQAISCVKL